MHIVWFYAPALHGFSTLHRSSGKPRVIPTAKPCGPVRHRSELPHAVKATLPVRVDPDSSRARWSKRHQQLTVRLAALAVENAKADDSWWSDLEVQCCSQWFFAKNMWWYWWYNWYNWYNTYNCDVSDITDDREGFEIMVLQVIQPSDLTSHTRDKWKQ